LGRRFNSVLRLTSSGGCQHHFWGIFPLSKFSTVRFLNIYLSIPLVVECFPFACTSHKYSPRSNPCIFKGYSPSHNGFRCHDPITSKACITHHARFDETNFPMLPSSPSRHLHSLDYSPFQSPIPTYSRPVIAYCPHFLNKYLTSIHCSVYSLSYVYVLTPLLSHCGFRRMHLQLILLRQTKFSSPRTPSQLHHLPLPLLPPIRSMVTRTKEGVFKPRHPAYLGQNNSGLVPALLSSSTPRAGIQICCKASRMVDCYV